MITAIALPVLAPHHAPCRAGNRLPKPIKTDPRMLEYRYLARLLAQRFVPRMAGQRDFDELFAVAMEGLWKATLKFDGERGADFKTFADTCIYNELEHEQRFVWSQCRRTWLRKVPIGADDEWDSNELVSGAPSPERAYAALELARAVLSNASDRNRIVVRAVLDGDTLADAGAGLSLSRESARVIFENACRVVRDRVKRREKQLA